jgi:hypothetical protein
MPNDPTPNNEKKLIDTYEKVESTYFALARALDNLSAAIENLHLAIPTIGICAIRKEAADALNQIIRDH